MGSASRIWALAAARRPAEIEAVGVATLDEAVAALGLERLDFIKADIEGFELRLIRGARRTLAICKPALLIEIDEPRLARAGDSLNALWDELLSLGYRPHEASPRRRRPCARRAAATCCGCTTVLAQASAALLGPLVQLAELMNQQQTIEQQRERDLRSRRCQPRARGG